MDKLLLMFILNREPSKCRKAAIMISSLVQQFVSVGFGIGLSVMYAELIEVFNAKRSNAALIQGLYLGTSVGVGLWFDSILIICIDY